MNNQQPERSISIQEMEIKAYKLNDILSFLKTCLFYIFWAYFVFKFYELLTNISTSSPEKISALSVFVATFKLDKILPMLVGVGGVAWGAKEHNQKKRLTELNGALRRKLESNDAYASRSGLDKHGHAEED